MSSNHVPSAPDDHYTIISADCHAGGNHETYREYLDPVWRDDFDAWRNKYKNPFRDLQDGGRVRNWDNDVRIPDMASDGVIAEVVFPNTVPPFFPTFVLFAKHPTDEDYPQRRAGIQAHNRWLKDWCSEYDSRRAGIGQVWLNNVEDAIEDATWIKENGLRGGILLPNIPPDCKYVTPLYDAYWDPFWRACEEMEIPLQVHGGTGSPDYGRYKAAAMLQLMEVSFYSQRPFVQLLMSGVFERFPNLTMVMAEQGSAWLPPMLERMDGALARIRETGRMGELKFDTDEILPRSGTEYFKQNCYVAVSQPSPEDAESRHVLGIDRMMWGSDYPHLEGTHPFTREHLRITFDDCTPEELHKVLAGNAAKLYDFDLEALAPFAQEHCPTVAELAEPLTAMPEDANQALLKAAHKIPA